MVRMVALALAIGACASAPAAAGQVSGGAVAASDRASLQTQLKAARTAAEAAQAEGRPRLAAHYLADALIDAASLNDLPQTLALGEHELALCRLARDVECEGDALVNGAYVEIKMGRNELALGHLDRAINLFRQTGAYRKIVVARYDAASVREELGDIVGAISDLRAVESASRDTPAHSAAFDSNMAELLLLAAKPAEALNVLHRASTSIAAPPDDHFPVPDDIPARISALTGSALAELGHIAESEAAFAAAMAHAASAADKFNTELDHARALLATHRTRLALPIIERLQPAADQFGATQARHFHEVAASVYGALGYATQALAQSELAAGLQAQLYRDSLAEAVASSDNAIALAEREATAERLARQTEAARGDLARTRIGAAAALVCLASMGLAALLVARARARRARASALAAERARISADIHDTLLQGLAGMAMQLRAAAQRPDIATAPVLARMADYASATLIEARRAVASIRTRPLPPEHGLQSVVEAWLAELRTRVGVALLLNAETPLPKLAPERIEELDGVLREAVANALKHSEPSRIEVALRVRASRIEASVADDGCGFDDARPMQSDRWGLRLMRERMARIGGKLQIRSTPGHGTVVIATLPC